MHFCVQSNKSFGKHNKQEIHIQSDGGLEKTFILRDFNTLRPNNAQAQHMQLQTKCQGA